MAAEVGDPAAAAAAAAAAGESRKLFVGGIPSSAQEGELRGHFARFGAVRSVVVMRDRETGLGRGFGFVEFEGEDAAAKALGDGDKPKHFICGREVDVRRARVRPPRNFGEQPVHHHQPEQVGDQGHQDNQPAGNGVVDGDDSGSYSSKKVFVGGLRDNITEQEFRAYFEAFGTVTDVVVIYDSVTSRSRGFGFVTFDSEEAVRKVMGKSFHDLKGTRVEAKIAIPKDAQYYRNGRGRGSRTFGVRGPASYDGLFQPYNDRHGFYNGFIPQPVPAPPYYPGPGLYVGMGGYPYANAYPNQGVMPNIPSMVARRPVYSPYPPMYPGYGFPYRAGYAGPTSIQHGVNGGGDYNNGQASIDLQEIDSADTVATKFEYMKLGSQ